MGFVKFHNANIATLYGFHFGTALKEGQNKTNLVDSTLKKPFYKKYLSGENGIGVIVVFRVHNERPPTLTLLYLEQRSGRMFWVQHIKSTLFRHLGRAWKFQKIQDGVADKVVWWKQICIPNLDKINWSFMVFTIWDKMLCFSKKVIQKYKWHPRRVAISINALDQDEERRSYESE